jgi:carboxyl-terminal processing protease
VEEIPLSSLIGGYARRGSIHGMLTATVKDPYSRYLVPSAYSEMKIDNSGEFGGVGIYLGMSKENAILVIAPIEGTPADRAKVKAGDHIVAIDGRSTVNMSTDEAANLMRGPKGTSVNLSIERGRDKERHEFHLVRDVIKVPSVKEKMLPGKLGYVRIASFSGTTADDFERSLERLEKDGMRGLIIDLRFNPGGLLGSAIDILNKLIGDGPLVHVVGRASAKQSFYARPGQIHPDYPVAVLINGGSASAAEIVAGALQDTHRGTVIGTKSFGKGSVQTIYPLRDGSALSLTTQKWLTPAGHSISQKGIMPDVVVKNPGDDEMEAELEKIRSEQKGAQAMTGQAPATAKSGQAKDAPVKDAPAKGGDQKAKAASEAQADIRDYQLEKAQELLEQQLGASAAKSNAA